MADVPSGAPVALTFAGIAGESPTPASPTAMPAAAGEALRAFFDAHPTVAFVQFEIALTEDGDDLEFAGGTLHGADGTPLRERDTQRAADALRRLLRADPHLAALPVALVVAMGGIEHTFRITRDATGASPLAGEPADPDERAAARERARLRAHDDRWDQRDVVRDDDHVA
jgi:hypothetical protein